MTQCAQARALAAASSWHALERDADDAGLAGAGLPDGAGLCRVVATLDGALLAARLDLQLASAAAAGAAWAALDLAGVPWPGPPADALRSAQDRVADLTARLVRCRPASELACLEQQVEEQWRVLQAARLAAASSGAKQVWPSYAAASGTLSHSSRPLMLTVQLPVLAQGILRRQGATCLRGAKTASASAALPAGPRVRFSSETAAEQRSAQAAA